MRRMFTAIAAGLVLFGASPASATDLDATVRLLSSYVETSTFNDRFSDSPSLQAEVNVNLTPHLYVSAYGYTGFKKPFRDDSSEYGFEAGYEQDVSADTTLIVAAGRYADYEGQGFHAGDWYGKVQVDHGRVSASAQALKGDTDSVLLRTEYHLPVGHKLTISPSVVYLTRYHQLNPGLTGEYSFSEKCSLEVRVVAPKDELSGVRHVYAAVGGNLYF